MQLIHAVVYTDSSLYWQQFIHAAVYTGSSSYRQSIQAVHTGRLYMDHFQQTVYKCSSSNMQFIQTAVNLGSSSYRYQFMHAAVRTFRSSCMQFMKAAIHTDSYRQQILQVAVYKAAVHTGCCSYRLQFIQATVHVNSSSYRQPFIQAAVHTGSRSYIEH